MKNRFVIAILFVISLLSLVFSQAKDRINLFSENVLRAHVKGVYLTDEFAKAQPNRK